jgi:hypothetical protein
MLAAIRFSKLASCKICVLQTVCRWNRIILIRIPPTSETMNGLCAYFDLCFEYSHLSFLFDTLALSNGSV